MSVAYTWVGWNRQKKVYDALLAGGVGLFLAIFVVVGAVLTPGAERVSGVILFIRALGVGAIVLLHVILCIGPLARLDRRFLPLLYNRRHMGVTMFLLALGHGALSVVWYHGFGDVNPLVSLLSANTDYTSLRGFPFEILGVIALLILFLMAATSHDFWLRNLTPRVWKTLHMGVYIAYGLLVMHVALGALQAERSVVYPVLQGVGLVAVAGLHIVAGRREVVKDDAGPEAVDGWIDAGTVDEIPANRARNVCVKGADGCARERIAVFKYEGRVSAVSNVCEHQGGPLGEGKVVDGCITCPWHGYQYLPGNGRSPAPFTEKIHTYRVTLRGRRIFVDPTPLPKGTPVEPAVIEEAAHG